MSQQLEPHKPAHTEWTVLGLLLDQARPLSLDELGRELGDRVAAIDAVANLEAHGLAHRTCEGFVFVTRAAARFSEIAE